MPDGGSALHDTPNPAGWSQAERLAAVEVQLRALLRANESTSSALSAITASLSRIEALQDAVAHNGAAIKAFDQELDEMTSRMEVRIRPVEQAHAEMKLAHSQLIEYIKSRWYVLVTLATLGASLGGMITSILIKIILE
jgi:hypothetical protein